MMKFLDTITESFYSLIYPSFCMHCCEFMQHAEFPLCKGCLALLEKIDPSERCPLCFSQYYSRLQNICAQCDYHTVSPNRMASTFDYEGPASTIVRKMKYGDCPHLAEGAGAMMAAQFMDLNWPIPEVIVPVPISLTRWMERGYNQSRLLGESIGNILNVPVIDVLGRKCGDYSQAGLSKQQRLTLDGRNLFLKQRDVIMGKTVLLVDDVLTTGSTINRCSEMLWEENPLDIYALTFCKVI